MSESSNLTKKKVLIFGAYSNGNIGDQFQANSVAHHIRRLCPDVDVYATSNSPTDKPYEFDSDFQISDARAIANPDIVNGFDALIIGGGGLLASVHDPLATAAWVETLKVPVFVMAVGASPDVALRCQALLERADIVTARDEYSLETIAAFRPDCTLLNDPILADERLDQTEVVATPELHRLCLIPRKQTEKNAQVYRTLNGYLRSRDRVVSMFPITDHGSGAIESLGSVECEDLWTMGELVDAIDASTVVVSERYHGCIIAMKRGVPCLGLISSDKERRSKVGELYRQLGHEHLLLSYRANPLDRGEIIDRLKSFDADRVKMALGGIRRDFAHEMGAILARLGLRQD